jgi:hypothetical protein
MLTNEQLDSKIKSIVALERMARGERKARLKALDKLRGELQDIKTVAVDLLLLESFHRLDLGRAESVLLMADYYKTILCDLVNEAMGVHSDG